MRVLYLGRFEMMLKVELWLSSYPIPVYYSLFEFKAHLIHVIKAKAVGWRKLLFLPFEHYDREPISARLISADNKMLCSSVHLSVSYLGNNNIKHEALDRA